MTPDTVKPSGKKVISLAKVRLASTDGHIIIVPARTPTQIPESLYLEAAKNGCVDYDPRMMEAFQAAMDNVSGAEDDDEVTDVSKFVKDAVRHVLLAAQDNADLLTKQGVPRVPAVKAAFESLLAENGTTSDVKVTSNLVEDYFIQVQEESEAVELDTTTQGAARYPEGVLRDGDLEGEEVGGGVEDMLERVGAVEE